MSDHDHHHGPMPHSKRTPYPDARTATDLVYRMTVTVSSGTRSEADGGKMIYFFFRKRQTRLPKKNARVGANSAPQPAPQLGVETCSNS
jgi:hypothetical protein